MSKFIPTDLTPADMSVLTILANRIDITSVTLLRKRIPGVSSRFIDRVLAKLEGAGYIERATVHSRIRYFCINKAYLASIEAQVENGGKLGTLDPDDADATPARENGAWRVQDWLLTAKRPVRVHTLTGMFPDIDVLHALDYLVDIGMVDRLMAIDAIWDEDNVVWAVGAWRIASGPLPGGPGAAGPHINPVGRQGRAVELD